MHFLTENDVQVIRELIQRERTRRNQPRTVQLQEEMLTPEVYVAYTPAGGIPGRSGTTPGSAICDVYTSGSTLTAISGLTRRVYNLNTNTIAGEQPVLIARDKFGKWHAVSGDSDGGEPGGTGTGTDTGDGGGPCDLAKLATTDCIKVTTNLGNFYLRYDGTGWTSSDTYAALGAFRAQWNGDTGLLDLLLGGTRLMNCLNGCYTGGPLTGHVAASATACASDTFTVCISCHCCFDPLWVRDAWYCVSITGTGTSSCEPLYVPESMACDVEICSGPYDDYAAAAVVCGPPETVQTDCCVDPVEKVLNWTITNKVGVCSCTPDSGTVTYDAAFVLWHRWSSVQFACLQQECEENAEYHLDCNGGTWGFAGSLVSATCDPFEVIFDVSPAWGGSYRITFTAP